MSAGRRLLLSPRWRRVQKQRLQRDLTALALAVYAETTGAPPRSLAVLDALAASGVRGLRTPG
ncbi:hypothetical protein EMIHUDRAFT_238808 [Emiliania huxleyi CCMP1516]|uniref:Uncharacterized protein n=2 Tax=Emiliania huxleyi TaxID=2903 RepID=A0A0D3JL70_EMIH1|nr:hypothetical protein EMIHUDRAFT_238808 [Emiliania huxleyi CCMP1516]EOD24255.1 hypothetical protein EMIHUDRAFT_238808 [Emiliania huxleyi CCMP1516]|eukprot:XP_005776684.1 hypothetical protein EMIHUDRAFT_238808 [Emiliania huxleyi CCMP1516]